MGLLRENVISYHCHSSPRNQEKYLNEERHEKRWPKTIKAYFSLLVVLKIVRSQEDRWKHTWPSKNWFIDVEWQYMACSLCSPSLTTYRFRALSKMGVNTTLYQFPPTHLKGQEQASGKYALGSYWMALLFFLYFGRKSIYLLKTNAACISTLHSYLPTSFSTTEIFRKLSSFSNIPEFFANQNFIKYLSIFIVIFIQVNSAMEWYEKAVKPSIKFNMHVILFQGK